MATLLDMLIVPLPRRVASENTNQFDEALVRTFAGPGRERQLRLSDRRNDSSLLLGGPLHCLADIAECIYSNSKIGFTTC